ncbi:MAG: hypothetical protein ACI8RD_001584 [Bacillariaceae sp.]|jgi:hypothetical protein
MNDEDWSVYWYYKCQEQIFLTSPGMTEEEADKKAIVYADNRFLKLKEARRVNGVKLGTKFGPIFGPMTDEDLKVYWVLSIEKCL